jgi:N-acetylmuramoyl-L-alanine amidase
MNRTLYIVLTAFFAFSICGTGAAQHKNFILVIDPGHGGEDPGTLHGRLFEQTLNLDVALKLGALIEKGMPDGDVLYTRTDDSAVGLAARGDFANRAGADLFLSIHTNANTSSSPSGSNTYVMGMDKSEANLEVAKLENEVIKYEQDYTETYAGFDEGSTEMSIIFGMMQYVHFESSLRFARLIQKHYGATTALRDRGAKQGPFLVLWKPTMPRVLTEMGFLSNEGDRRYLSSERGRDAIAKALYAAFREYKSPGPDTTGATANGATANGAPATVPAPPAPSAATPAPTPPPATATTPATAPKAPKKGFYVQLAASRNPIPVRDRSWGEYRGKVVEMYIDGWYKYALGPYSTRKKASSKLGEVRQTEFRGAFIVEY